MDILPHRRPAALSPGRSYAWCERVARRQAGNFYHAFRILPPPQRRAMCALYAFMRVTDDVTDEPGPPEDKRLQLDAWRAGLDRALAGQPSHPLHPAFCDTLRRYAIPRGHVDAVLDGVAMDLERTSYDTFEDLYCYCYRVASAVGLCCIHIWGFSHPAALGYAEAAGIAFQLTNILRDLGEDAGRGRIYLPCEDLARFGYGAEDLRAGLRDDRFRALMCFEEERARSYYRASRPLADLLAPAGRAVFLVMWQTYQDLLDVIAASDHDVFTRRARVSRWRKLWLAARALPIRWGWV